MTGSCVICDTTPTGCPRSRPRVSLSIYLSIYLSIRKTCAGCRNCASRHGAAAPVDTLTLVPCALERLHSRTNPIARHCSLEVSQHWHGPHGPNEHGRRDRQVSWWAQCHRPSWCSTLASRLPGGLPGVYAASNHPHGHTVALRICCVQVTYQCKAGTCASCEVLKGMQPVRCCQYKVKAPLFGGTISISSKPGSATRL